MSLLKVLLVTEIDFKMAGPSKRIWIEDNEPVCVTFFSTQPSLNGLRFRLGSQISHFKINLFARFIFAKDEIYTRLTRAQPL